MDTQKEVPPTRIAVSKQELPPWVLVVAILCLEFAFLLLTFAFLDPWRLWWWVGTAAATALAWHLYKKFSHGPREWDRITYLELRDGKIALVPGRKDRGLGYTTVEASFPTGSVLEYHVETADAYFAGDHGHVSNLSVWVVPPTGKKEKLRDFAYSVSPKIMAANLRNHGIPFRAVAIYDGENGEHCESEITARFAQGHADSKKRAPTAILLGSCNLWLGVLAGCFAHSGAEIIGIGVVGYILVSIVALRSASSRKSAILATMARAPMFAAGYAFVVIAVWYLIPR